LEMAGQKREGRCSRLVVTGCLAERYRDELRKEIPEIDAVLGTGEVEKIVEALGARDSGLGVRGPLQSPGASPLPFYRRTKESAANSRAVSLTGPENPNP